MSGGNKNISFANQVLVIFAKSPFRSFNYKQVASQMGVRDKASRYMVQEVIETFCTQQVLVETKKGKFKLSDKSIPLLTQKKIEGEISIKRSGKAYVTPKSGDEEVFVNFANLNRALHGDIVEVQLFPRRKRKKKEGEVVAILKRATNQFSGILNVKSKMALLETDSNGRPFDIIIPKASLNGGVNNDRAIVEVDEWPESSAQPFGSVVRVLGQQGSIEVEIASILFDKNIEKEFPKSVMSEVKKITSQLPKKELNRRKDFRNCTTFTIDPDDAKDFDDALSVDFLPNGNVQVGVHIADVSYYVKEGTALDEEALDRGTSVYLVNQVIPMLPEKLSNDLCSLRPNEDKLAFSVVFEIDKKATIVDSWIGETVINSDRRFNYDEAQNVIDEKGDDCKKEIQICHHIAQKWRADRFSDGAINFSSKEVRFLFSDDGMPSSVYVKEYKEANMLIEEFMLQANKTASLALGKNSTSMVYRLHAEPESDKLHSFARLVLKFGYTINMQSRKMLSLSINDLARKMIGTKEQSLLENVVLRTMSKAYYSTINIGHFGLSFDSYSHFTSPIRRYPDLMVHRLIKQKLQGEAITSGEITEQRCEHCSQMELRAKEAERGSVNYMQALYMKKHVGQVFEGAISGISKWGMYVTLIESGCDGMVRYNDMNDDFYFIDEDNYRMVGRGGGKVFTIGDQITVRVKRVDVFKQQIDLLLMQHKVK